MGIQINGNTNNINAGIGSLSIEDLREIDIVGVATASNFKTGTSNLHSTGLTLTGGQLDVGSNIKLGTAGVITATSFSGSGANLTGIQVGGASSLSFNDNVGAYFGNSQDLKIHHDSSHSYLHNINGNLILRSNYLTLRNEANDQVSYYHENNGTTMLYYAGSSKIRTTSTGIRVTDDISIGDKIVHEGDTNTAIRFPAADTITAETGGSERLRIASDGATKVCHNGGAFGVGGDPINKFGITASDNNFFGLHRSNASTGTGEFNINVESNSQVTFSIDDEGAFSFGTSTDPSAQSGYTERLRINSSGNITFGVSGSNTPLTSAAVKNIDGGRDYWNSTKGDYRALRYVVYNGGNSDNMYGIGISNSELEIQSQSAIGVYAGTDGAGTGRRRKRITMNSAGGVAINNTDSNAVHSMSNYDHGNLEYSHRNGRTLTSNGTGWDGNQSADGADPILILGVTDRAGNSDIGDAYGLCLHSDSQDNNDYGPLIGWSNRSNSGSYNTTYAAIVGQKTGQSTDANWSSGALHFFTQKPGAYMDSTADLSISESGYVSKPRNPCFHGNGVTSPSNSAGGFNGNLSYYYTVMTANISGSFKTSGSDAGKFVAPIAGTYYFYGQALLRQDGNGQGSGELTFYKNGVNVAVRSLGYTYVIESSSGGHDHDNLHISCILTLAVGEKVNLQSTSTSSGVDWYWGQGLGNWGGYLLG